MNITYIGDYGIVSDSPIFVEGAEIIVRYPEETRALSTFDSHESAKLALKKIGRAIESVVRTGGGGVIVIVIDDFRG